MTSARVGEGATRIITRGTWGTKKRSRVLRLLSRVSLDAASSRERESIELSAPAHGLERSLASNQLKV